MRYLILAALGILAITHGAVWHDCGLDDACTQQMEAPQ
jgi:hypothetical protein